MVAQLARRVLESTATTSSSLSSSSAITNARLAWLGWVAKPNLPYGRGTLDIIWACLFTIFICTWTIQHPMVPKRGEKWYLVSFRKVQLMAFTVIAPEMLIGSAIGEYWLARASVRKDPKVTSEWTTTHGFFALMEGFVVESGDHFYRVNDEGILLLKMDRCRLLNVTEGDIKDRSKADILVKATAFLQALWLLIQCCARAQQNLPITPLELATVGFVGCSLVTYTAWISKPQQVNKTITILQNENNDSLDVQSKVNEGWMIESDWPITNDYRDSIVKAFEQDGRLSMVHYFAGHHGYSMKFSMAAGLLFGSIHIAAWNFAFPSKAETILWRVAAVASTAMPATILLLLLLPDIAGSRFRNNLYNVRNKLFGRNPGRTVTDGGRAVGMIEYIIAVYGTMRFYLLVAIFITFRSQPANVYATVDWSKYIPHFG